MGYAHEHIHKDPNHLSNGGTFLCRWSDKPDPVLGTDGPAMREATRASVQAFGDPDIWFEGNEMHTRKRDLSDFWRFHDKRNPKVKLP